MPSQRAQSTPTTVLLHWKISKGIQLAFYSGNRMNKMHAIFNLTGYLSRSNISVFSNSSIKKKKLKTCKIKEAQTILKA